MNSYDVSSLLHEVEAASTSRNIAEFNGTITKALAQRAIHELASEPDFWASVNRLIATVEPEHDQTVLFALAELGRLSAALKAKGGAVVEIANGLLGKRIPTHLSYGDGDQRYYAAIAWDRSGFPFDRAVAARTAVMEDSSEKARRAWLRLLFRDCGVSDCLNAVIVAFGELQWLLLPNSDRPFDSSKERVRRVALLLRAIRTEMNADEVEIDDDITTALANFVSRAFAYISIPDRYQDTAKAVEEFAALVLHTIRIKFRLLTEPDLYSTVVRTKRWLPDGGWQLITSRNKVIERLRATLIEGLVLLLKQGKVSTELAEIHRQLSPTLRHAKTELAAIAAEQPDLPPEMRNWLETGEVGADDYDIGFSETDDTAIALALLAAYDLPKVDPSSFPRESGQQSTLTTKAEKKLGVLVDRVDELRNRVLSIAKRRNLSVFGEVGSIVEFSEHAHRSVGQVGASKVRVIKRGVETTADRGRKVVIRAIVS